MGRIFFRFGKTTPDEWDSIEKALSHKYIRRIPTGKPDRPWYYIYAETFLKPFKALADIFGISEKRVGDDFEKENIKKEYGVDKKTFAAHILEYFTNKEKWNKIFGAKENREKYKKPIQQKTLVEAVAKQTLAKPKEKKRIINRSLMKKVWSLYSPQGKQVLQDEKDAEKIAKMGNGGSGGDDDGNGNEPPKNGVAAKLRDEFTKNTNEYLGKDFTNKATGIKARFSKESQKELRSRTQNTKDNGFTLQQHFEVANKIKELFENADLIKEHGDTKHGYPNMKIERFLSKEMTLQSGQKVQACITVKHTLDTDGRTIYSLEAMDIKNALEKTRAKGQVSDESATVSNSSIIAQSAEKVKEKGQEKLDGIVDIGGYKVLAEDAGKIMYVRYQLANKKSDLKYAREYKRENEEIKRLEKLIARYEKTINDAVERARQRKSGMQIANDSIVQQVAETPSVSFNPNDENYAYKDTGYIAGSQKEKIAAFWATKTAVGDGVTVEEIDWNALEENPRYAEKQIVKKNIARKVDYEALQKGGMSGGAGFLYDKVMNSVATSPKESTVEARRNYVLAINTLQSRLEDCKNVEQIKNALSEINSEIKGEFMGIEELPEYLEYSNRIANLKETIKNENKVKIDASIALENALKDEKISSLFKAFLDDFKQNSSLKDAKGALQGSKKSRDDFWERMALESKAWHDFMDSHKDKFSENGDFKKYLELTKGCKRRVLENWYGETVYLESSAEIESQQIKNAQNEFVKSVHDEYRRSNPICEAWRQLGEGFENCALTASELKNWSKSKRFSKTFERHIWNANDGKFDDWDWLPKEKENSASGEKKQRKVAFQLLVAKEHERVGGRNVSVKSTSDLKKMFNLRDIQSGTWVLDDPVSAKWHVDRCCEGFADLCDVTGIPESLVSLNGRLALAIGARGHGGALAHYEPVERVINITKMKGGGSLAHEWFHSFDNLLSEAISGGDYNAWYTNDGHHGTKKASDEIPEVKEAFSKLVKTMRDGDVPLFDTVNVNKSDKENWRRTLRRLSYVVQTEELYKQIAAETDYEKAMKLVQDSKPLFYDENDTESHKEFGIKKFVSVQKAIAAKFEMEEAKIDTGRTTSQYYQDALALDGGKEKYWSSAHEMAARAFSGFVGDSLREKNRKNTYLSSHDRNFDYEEQGFLSKPNPEGKEREKINEAFRELFDTIKATGAIRKAIVRADIETLKKNFTAESKVEALKKSSPWCYFKKDGYGDVRFYIKKSVYYEIVKAYSQN